MDTRVMEKIPIYDGEEAHFSVWRSIFEATCGFLGFGRGAEAVDLVNLGFTVRPFGRWLRLQLRAVRRHYARGSQGTMNKR